MDKFALVTNANNQLGKEVVKKLISENYMVFASDSNYDNKKFGNLIYLNLDPNSSRSIENAKKNILRYTSRLEAIVHLNNYFDFGSMLEIEIEQLEESLKQNFFEVFRINKVMWDLVGYKNGKIIHDCSDVAAFDFAPFNGVYSLAKGMLVHYNDILRKELSARGVDVIRVHTGYVNDEDFEFYKNEYHKTAENSKYFYREMIQLIDLNMSKDSLVSIDDYCDFIAKIVKSRNPQEVYYYSYNKDLKKASKMKERAKDIFYRKFK